MNGYARYLLTAALVPLVSSTGASGRPTIEIEDAIAMTRVQQAHGRGDDIVFSPDGHRFACVVWKGDLESNRNVYSLLLFDLRRQPAGPTVLLSDAYQPDAIDQHATPISGLRFLSNSLVAFIGSLRDSPARVYTVNVDTKEVRQLASHSTAIRSFDASTNAKVLAFSAVTAPDERMSQEMRQAGFSVFDDALPTPISASHGFEAATPQYPWSVLQIGAFGKTAYGRWFTPMRDYFVSAGASAAQRLLDGVHGYMATELNELQILGRPDLTVSPTGSHAVVFPYTRIGKWHWSQYRYFRDHYNPYVQAMVTSLGLVDVRTRRSEPLLATPIEFYSTPRPMWSPDSNSVIVRSVLPATEDKAFDTDPHLIEVDIATKRVFPIPGSAGWEPVRWGQPDSVMLRRGSSVGASVKRDGKWQPITIGATQADTGLNPRYTVSTNGTVVVGVKDSLTIAPELAVYDIMSRRTTVVTALNPELLRRQYAPVEKIFWEGTAGDTAFGYLIKPIGYVEGMRYPAIILLKDTGISDSSDDSYIIDGQQQLNGWAIQTFAARGLLVLLTPPPPSFREAALTAREAPLVMAHVENAIAYLDDRKLVDRRRLGLSGWSRASYWADYILTHSDIPFAAATDLDGGGNYQDFQQRWGATEDERDDAGRFQLDVQRMRTPLLSEQYGPTSLIGQGEFIMAIRVLGKPVDLYYYPDAPHGLKRPMHRLYSLRRHLDWFRFWLQDYEDPDPQKQQQYDRWRKLRVLRSGPAVQR